VSEVKRRLAGKRWIEDGSEMEDMRVSLSPQGIYRVRGQAIRIEART
jgi:hypothetical protein